MNTSSMRSVVAVVAFVLAPVLSAPAGEPTEQVRQTTDRILDIVRDPELKAPAQSAERKRRIRLITDQRFAWPEMARRALGQYWKERTDEQKQEFTSLLRDLVVQAYIGEIESYSGEVIRYEGDTIEGDTAVVKVTVVTRKNTEIPIEYRVFTRKPEPQTTPPTQPATKPVTPWIIYDVKIEGLSLVNKYRTEVRDIMVNSTYEELVKKLRARVTEDAPPGEKGKAPETRQSERGTGATAPAEGAKG